MSSLIISNEELYRRVDEVLYYIWDPIGVNDLPEARDEYLSYVPLFVALLLRGASVDELVVELNDIAAVRIGLSGFCASATHARRAAQSLCAWRDELVDVSRSNG